jgi:hypothetical protein
MKLKVNKTIAKMMLERVRGEPTDTRSELTYATGHRGTKRSFGRSARPEKRAHAKASRQWGKRVAAGEDDYGSNPKDTVSDIIYNIPSVKISNGNSTLPAGKTVKGVENLRRYLGNLGMAFAWNEPEVMPYADDLDKLFNIHDDAAQNFADQYEYAADEKRFMDDQERYSESKMIRIKRSDLTRMVHQVLSDDAIGGAMVSSINDAVSQQMANIQKQREEIAEKMKVAIAAQDERALENLQKQLDNLDRATEELTDAQQYAVDTVGVENIPSDEDPAEYTTTEGKIRRSDLVALIREAEKELSDLKPIGQMTDEELKAKYHPEDTLADAVHYAISAEGDGSEASWQIIKGVMDKVRATLTPAKDGSRGPSAEERRLTQQIMAGNFHKRLQDMAEEVARDLGWIE